jgi:hypothetical protein
MRLVPHTIRGVGICAGLIGDPSGKPQDAVQFLDMISEDPHFDDDIFIRVP